MRMEIIETDYASWPGYQDEEKKRIDDALEHAVKVETHFYTKANYGSHAWVMKLVIFYK